MSSVEEQPFELRLRVAFSREVIFVAPPVPNSPAYPSAPRVKIPLGSVVFYFDNWDIPGGNEEGAPTWGYDSILVHFVPETVPPAVSLLFSTVNHELIDALFWDPNHPSLAVFSHLVSIPLDETDSERARRLENESARRDVESGLTRRCEEACDRLFAKPEIAEYFRDLSQSLDIATQRFLEVLRLRYQQVLIPDRPKLDWMNGHWILAEAVVPRFAVTKPVPPSFTTIVSGYELAPEERVKEVSQPLLRRLFGNRGSDVPAVCGSVHETDWSEIARQIQDWGSTKPPLSEVLIATALGQCDVLSGNPRLAIIEAIVALEIEVKASMTLALKKYRISKAAIDRVVRETPLSDLVSVWIRREALTDSSLTPKEDTYARCNDAIHLRNELIHHSKRTLSSEYALELVQAVAAIVTWARQMRSTAATDTR